MNKFYLILAAFILSITASLSSYAANPCMPIAEACKQQGYSRSGPEGKMLIKNCVMPVASGEKTLPNTNFDQTVLQQCKMLIMEKMQNR
jgi:hypothetical protein